MQDLFQQNCCVVEMKVNIDETLKVDGGNGR
jgi:hypothetical protein